MDTIATLQTSFGKVKILLAVVACCRQHCTSEELARLLCACRYATWGKPVKGYLLHASKLLYNIPPRFQGCTLQWTLPKNYNKQTLGSHCQCLAEENHYRRTRERPEDRRVQIRIPGRRRGRRCQIGMKVPLWAMCSIDKDASYFMPRKQERDASRPSAAGFDYKDMFRPHHGESHSRCQVPEGIFEVHKSCLEAIDALLVFLTYVREELQEIFSDVGMTPQMLRLIRAGTAAFDWRLLLSMPPGTKEKQGFCDLVSLLKPYLEKGCWPHGVPFSKVPQTWDLSRSETLKQYTALVSRVRCWNAMIVWF